MYLEIGFDNILQAFAELAIGANIEQKCTLPFHGAFSSLIFPLHAKNLICLYLPMTKGLGFVIAMRWISIHNCSRTRGIIRRDSALLVSEQRRAKMPRLARNNRYVRLFARV
jgi:hypothetical protein